MPLELIRGADVILLVDVAGPNGPAMFIPVAAQTGLTRSSDRPAISRAHVVSPFERNEYGRLSQNVILDSLYVMDIDGYDFLVKAHVERRKVVVRMNNGKRIEQATGVITTIGEIFELLDVATFSATIFLDNTWEVIA